MTPTLPTPGSEIGEPLVSDARLARIAGRIRKEFPGLPETAWFTTYRQEPTFGHMGGAISVPVGARAIFLIGVTNPVNPDKQRLFAAHCSWEEWAATELANRHSSDLATDIVYLGLRMKAKEATDWVRSFQN